MCLLHPSGFSVLATTVNTYLQVRQTLPCTHFSGSDIFCTNVWQVAGSEELPSDHHSAVFVPFL